MSFKTRATILYFFLLGSISAQFDSPKFQHISIESGLSQANVRCVLQDRNGFLWFGTQDGLNRYDGYEFVIFRNNPSDSNSIAGNLITCMHEDRHGNIWIGTISGLSKYYPITNKFKNYFQSNKTYSQEESVSAIVETKDGTIWIGYNTNGLSKYLPKTDSFLKFCHDPNNQESLSHNFITGICEDKEGNLWLGTFNSGLNKLNVNAGKFQHYVHNAADENSLSSNSVNSLCLDRNGKIFVGCTNGLNIFMSGKNKFQKYFNDPNDPKSISGNHVSCIYKDKSGNMWIGTDNDGLNLFDEANNSFIKFGKNINDKNSLNDNVIWSILEDRNNIFWIGTSTGGINKMNFNKKKFVIVSTEGIESNSLSSNSVRSILKDKGGSIWIGTDNGLNRINKQTNFVQKYFHKFQDKHSLCNNKVWSIVQDNKGTIWIGTQTGLSSYNPATDDFRNYPINYPKKDLPSEFPIRSIYVDEYYKLWLGTFGHGLIKFDPATKKFEKFLLADETVNGRGIIIFQIYSERENRLWLATTTGLLEVDLNSRKIINQNFSSEIQNVLNTKVIYSILKDKANNIWIGTLAYGLIKFNPQNKSIRIFTDKDGLSNNVVYGILEDDKANLWLSTNKGISKLNTSNGHFSNYNTSDGLCSDEFNTGAFYKDEEGTLYFGGIGGVSFFHPDSIHSNPMPPVIAITDFKIFDKNVDEKKIYLDGEEIILSYNDNFFSFEFAALDFTEPTKNKYAYMLEGIDDKWIYPTNRRYAAYTNLEPGSYIFKVKASNNDNTWNEKGISLRILIVPPFWMTWWFKILILAIIISTFVSVFLFRINKLKKEKTAHQNFSRQLIDSQEFERKRIAGELHDGIGHDLLIIKNRTQIALKLNEVGEIKKQLENISEITSDSIDNIRKFTYNLHPYHLDEIGLTRSIQALVNKIAETSSIKFSCFLDNIDSFFPSDIEINIFRIIQEGMNNIVKHSEAHEAVISVSEEDSGIKVLITDDGKGFSTSNARDKSNATEGFGLKGISERIRFCNGNLVINSSLGKGTTVIIQIPKNNT